MLFRLFAVFFLVFTSQLAFADMTPDEIVAALKKPENSTGNISLVVDENRDPKYIGTALFFSEEHPETENPERSSPPMIRRSPCLWAPRTRPRPG